MKLATTTSEEVVEFLSGGEGSLGVAKGLLPRCQDAFPFTLAGAPQLRLYQTPGCACYKFCKIWLQGRAAELRLEALLSELNLSGILMKGDSFLLKVFDVTILIRSDTLLSPVEYLFHVRDGGWRGPYCEFYLVDAL